MKFKKLSDKDLYALCREYGQKARLWRRRFAGLLPEVASRRLYKRRGFDSLYEFAAKLGGMSKESVDKVLRVAKKLEDKPGLMSILESGSQGWSKLERVAYIATQETDSFWIEKVTALPSQALGLFVQNFRLKNTADGKIEAENHSRCTETVKETLHLELDPALIRKLRVLIKRQDFEKRLEHFVEQLEADAWAETPNAMKTQSRHIPANIKRFVSNRSGGLCAFPTCNKKASSMHHTERWALQKAHDPARLHAVCIGHERLAHHGLIGHEEKSPEYWMIKDKADDVGPKAYIDSLVALHRESG